jgi:hypothetical protein
MIACPRDFSGCNLELLKAQCFRTVGFRKRMYRRVENPFFASHRELAPRIAGNSAYQKYAF